MRRQSIYIRGERRDLSLRIQTRETNRKASFARAPPAALLLAHAEQAVSKQAEGAELNATVVVYGTNDEPLNVTNLHLGTSYYVRVKEVSQDGVLGINSPWSDPIQFLCPEGGYCGPPGAPGRPSVGVPIEDVVAREGHFRLPWADNATFAECPTAGVVR